LGLVCRASTVRGEWVPKGRRGFWIEDDL
jgi:hypothetical protein